LLVVLVLDSKRCTPLSKLETMPFSPSVGRLLLICPAAEAQLLTHTPKSLATDNHNTVQCKDIGDVSSDEASEHWINVYRGKTYTCRSSANSDKACSKLL